MEKRVLQTYAVWARDNLEQQIEVSLKTLGINGDNDFREAKQSGDFTYIEGDPNSYPASLYGKRREIISEVRLKGYQNIIEEVAYTWFNRLVALRFMELHNYLSHGFRVLSSTSGSIEPDILKNLSLAKTDLRLDMKICEQLKSQNKTEELFRHVLICQCGALSDVLPRLFSRDSGYMELLLPKSLLIGETVLTRLVKIPEENFMNDVQIIGWLYQYYNTKAKEKVFASLKKNIKISKEDIPAATQLFTPDWIVRYMVENSLGRLWLEGHPNDALKAQWKYYLDEAEQEPEVQAQLEQIRAEYRSLKPEEIKVIDPCMGSGHILVYIFDVLMQIYESQGYTQRDAAQNIVRHNLHGLDIDKRAAQLAYFAVMMKARQYDRRFFSSKLQPMVYSTTGDEDGENFGSLLTVDDPGEMPEDSLSMEDLVNYERRLNVWNYRYLLAQKYHVVVTNPPYMGTKGINAELSELLSEKYESAKSDIYGAFIIQCLNLCNCFGITSMITQRTWLFISAFEKLRKELLYTTTPLSFLELGSGAFDDMGGEVVQSVVFAINKSKIKGFRCSYTDLSSDENKADSLFLAEEKYLIPDAFDVVPGTTFAMKLSGIAIEIFSEAELLGTICLPKKGLISSDNNRFLRLWPEVSLNRIQFGMQQIEDQQEGKRWVPHNKGGSFRRWYGNQEYLINWENDGAEVKGYAAHLYKSYSRQIMNERYYFKESISWSSISAQKIGVRYYPCGFTFDTAGPSMFIENHGLKNVVFGFLSSCVSEYYISAMNPTINLLASDIANLPIILNNEKDNILVSDIVEWCIATAKTDWDSFETSWDFTRHPLVRRASTVAEAFAAWESECNARFTQLKANEEELNRIFIDIYGLQDELTPEVDDKDVTVRRADRERDVKSLISYLIGVVMGRYSLDIPGLAYAGGEWDASKYQTYHPDEDGIIPIYRGIGMEDGLTAQIIGLLKFIYGEDTYRQNIDFIAESIGHNNNESSEEALNRYLNDGFFADHLKIYQKRPIYWFFSSGKNSGFKCLVYMHRYTRDTLARINSRYFLPESTRLKNELEELAGRLAKAEGRDRVRLEKERQKLAASYNEAIEYGQVLDHMANQYIEIDLDDGVKVNYAKFQGVEMVTDSGNKVRKDLLAPIK